MIYNTIQRSVVFFIEMCVLLSHTIGQDVIVNNIHISQINGDSLSYKLNVIVLG